MPDGWKEGVLAGIISAIVFLSSATGLLIAGLLSFFTSFSLFWVGLSAGTARAVIGVITSFLIITFSANGTLGLFFLGVIGLPVIGLNHLALLNRTVTNEQGERDIEWYPAGRMLAWLSAYAAVALLLATTLSHLYFGESLALEMRTSLNTDLEHIEDLQNDTQSPLLSDEQINRILKILPGYIAISLASMIAANAGLAQRILVRTGRAIRPSPNIRDLELPEVLSLALAASIALWLLTGETGVLGGSLANIFLVPYFLLGLVVVHAISSDWSRRTALLTLFYLLCLFIYGLAVLVALLGLAEPWVHFRQKYAKKAVNKRNT